MDGGDLDSPTASCDTEGMLAKILLTIFLTVPTLALAEVELPWWAVSPEEVLAAPCKTQAAPSLGQIMQDLQTISGGKSSQIINGISFRNESPALLKFFADLNRLDISLNGQPELKFQSRCTQVLCAVQEIYGATEGLQLLFLLKTYGFNGSHLRTKHASAWTAAELDEVLQALGDYPLHLYPVAYNKRLVHFTRGKRYTIGDRTIANASIEIFDLWNELSFAERQQTLLHELGHTLAYNKRLDSSPQWLSLGGWKEVRRKYNGIEYRDYVLEDPSKAVSEYGMENPSEDFAESVVAYRFAVRRLKQNHPLKYDFLKTQAFASREYLSEEQCRAQGPQRNTYEK